jgi:hypothetical protein
MHEHARTVMALLGIKVRAAGKPWFVLMLVMTI